MEIFMYLLIFTLYIGLPAIIIFFIFKSLSNQKKIREEIKYLNSSVESLIKKIDSK